MTLNYTATTKAYEVSEEIANQVISALPVVVGVSEKQTEYAKSIVKGGFLKLFHPAHWDSFKGGSVETTEMFDNMIPAIASIIDQGAGKVIENKASFEKLAANKSALLKG